VYPHLHRGRHPRRPRRLPLPAEHAGDDHPADRGARVGSSAPSRAWSSSASASTSRRSSD
jgi:hypothetical protein